MVLKYALRRQKVRRPELPVRDASSEASTVDRGEDFVRGQVEFTFQAAYDEIGGAVAPLDIRVVCHESSPKVIHMLEYEALNERFVADLTDPRGQDV